jgi:predicted Holliday junction resolvase-like endonuclease
VDTATVNIIAVLGVLLAAVIGVAVWLLRLYLRLRDQFEDYRADADDFRATVPGLIRRASDSAIRQSKATRTGQAGQHLVPLLPGFNYEPAEVRWLGGVVDMIVFRGLSDPEAEVEVVFVEIKTRKGWGKGIGALSQEQRRVRDAVQDKRVTFEVYPLPRPEPEPVIDLSRLVAEDVPIDELPTGEEIDDPDASFDPTDYADDEIELAIEQPPGWRERIRSRRGR